MALGFETDNIQQLIAKELIGLGFELSGIELNLQHKPKVIKVYVEVYGEERAVNLDDCVKISYHLNKILSIVPDLKFRDYALEVSSPGVERRFFNLSQMGKYLGYEVRLRLYSPLEGKSKFLGILKSVDYKTNSFLIEMDGKDWCFDFDKVNTVNLVCRKYNL